MPLHPPEDLRGDIHALERVIMGPWYAPSALAILVFPVKLLATRRACMVASVPELVRRTISMEGIASWMAS
jgi:hypothetical protein